jgi:hypothetical protein
MLEPYNFDFSGGSFGGVNSSNNDYNSNTNKNSDYGSNGKSSNPDLFAGMNTNTGFSSNNNSNKALFTTKSNTNRVNSDLESIFSNNNNNKSNSSNSYVISDDHYSRNNNNNYNSYNNNYMDNDSYNFSSNNNYNSNNSNNSKKFTSISSNYGGDSRFASVSSQPIDMDEIKKSSNEKESTFLNFLGTAFNKTKEIASTLKEKATEYELGTKIQETGSKTIDVLKYTGSVVYEKGSDFVVKILLKKSKAIPLRTLQARQLRALARFLTKLLEKMTVIMKIGEMSTIQIDSKLFPVTTLAIIDRWMIIGKVA